MTPIHHHFQKRLAHDEGRRAVLDFITSLWPIGATYPKN
jgi:hypothetical protein